ncbi:hypothetical protein EG347_04485 [Chryseobacterium sp. G0186]|uniref:hypothetical protein n=1 Tax=Chryseobacterium sp. G0186 TaxID=2487064 RepID=UPI000F5173D7|nr:hypothetical protein [Chryseobacterium sp. G0186]AZA76825.1 hypothetical protein EG347_04485 [Chryseobacterium sp. G0186]
MKKIPQIGCACEKPTPNYTEYRSSELGIDQTNGRHAEVTIQQCKLCQRIWIRYFVEFEHITKSGRWYKGIVTKKDRGQITPENAVEFLESLEWYVYGGSFFESTGTFGQGKLNVDG